MTEKNEPETDKLDGDAETAGDRVFNALLYVDTAVASSFGNPEALEAGAIPFDSDDRESMLTLAAEVRRLREENARLNKENDDWHKASRELREENSALLNRVGAYDFEVTRLQKALAEEKSLTAATAEHTAQLEAKLKWFERFYERTRPMVAGSCSSALKAEYIEDLVRWERENPPPGATT